MKPIPYGKQYVSDEDIEAVVGVLRSDYLTQGPVVREFEEAFAKYIGCKYAVAVSNGTAALHLAALALNVKTGAKVITTPITFAASANCMRYCGAEVVFADIDPATYCLDIKSVESILAKSHKGEYSGIVAVDFAGYPLDLEDFRMLADDYRLWLLEDACHSPGAYFVDFKGQKQFCGGGMNADISVFSFHPVKHIACGEGGMVTTNDEGIYQNLCLLRTHGITKEQDLFKNPLEVAYGVEAGELCSGSDTYPGWYYEMQGLGYNYRLTDIQAALGASQLKRADAGLQRRREIASVYNHAFEGKRYLKGQSGYNEGHAYHLYVIEVDDRNGLYQFLRKNRIYAQIHYVPTYLMPYYAQFGWQRGACEMAERYYSRCLSLPMYPTLTEEELSFVIRKVDEYYEEG